MQRSRVEVEAEYHVCMHWWLLHSVALMHYVAWSVTVVDGPRHPFHIVIWKDLYIHVSCGCDCWSMVVTPEIGSEWTVFRVHVTVLRENGTTVNLNINCQKTKTMFICCEPMTMNVEDQSVDYVDGLCYLGSVVDSFLDSLRWRRGILHDPASRRSNISGNCRQFVPLQSSDYLTTVFYGGESWPNDLLNELIRNQYI